MKSKQPIPKDLGVKICSKEEAFWTLAKGRAKEAILNNQREIAINNAIIILADARIQEEKEKV